VLGGKFFNDLYFNAFSASSICTYRGVFPIFYLFPFLDRDVRVSSAFYFFWLVTASATALAFAIIESSDMRIIG
jgi:hypothetical protein